MLTFIRRSPVLNSSQISKKFSHDEKLYEIKFPHYYTSDEESAILKTINSAEVEEFNRYAVSVARCKKLVTYRKKHGEFTTLHQILGVEGFGIKILRSLCQSILHPLPEEAIQLKKSRPLNFVTPELNKQKCESLKKVIGLNLGTRSLSWAGIDVEPHSLFCWGHHTLALSPDVKRHHETKILDAAYDAFQHLPEADTYIMESYVTGGVSNSKNMSFNQERLQLSSMLLVLLHQAARDRGDQQSVIFQRSSLWCRLYGTLVGGERVACHSIVENILRGAAGPWTHVHCSPENMNIYNKETPAVREAMGAALLLTTSFLDVSVKGLPACWQILRGKPPKASKTTL